MLKSAYAVIAVGFCMQTAILILIFQYYCSKSEHGGVEKVSIYSKIFIRIEFFIENTHIKQILLFRYQL